MPPQKINILKYEQYLFLAVILIHLIPVVGIRFFPSVDGPAHLYNANLLKQFWFYGENGILSFFNTGSGITPNWLNHLCNAIAGLVLPSYLTEKSFILLYIIGLPLSFRYLVSTISPSEKTAILSSYLIFPFIYSFPFCIGFFNFCAGIPILLFTIAYWIRHRKKLHAGSTILLVLLSASTYFAHLFDFLLLGLVLFMYEILNLSGEKKWQGLFRRLGILAGISFPGIIFSIIFIVSNSGGESSQQLNFNELLFILTRMTPLITLNFEAETLFASIVLFTLGIITSVALVYSFLKLRKTKKISTSAFILLSAIIILLLFFVLPDWMVSGGFISVRLALFFFMLVTLWVSTQEIPAKILAVPVAILLGVSLWLIPYHYRETKKLSDDVKELVSIVPAVQEGSTLLPLNYSTNWIHSNFSNYLGSDKYVIVLDNYEATKPHFPLSWKVNQNPYDLIGSFGTLNPCITIGKYEKLTGHRIDYISRWCFTPDENDSCKTQTQQLLDTHFELVVTSPEGKMELFKRR